MPQYKVSDRMKDMPPTYESATGDGGKVGTALLNFARKDELQNAQLVSKMNSSPYRGADAGKKSGRATSHVRFIVCAIGLISITMSQTSRIILNNTLPSMLRNTGSKAASTIGSCPDPGLSPWEPPLAPPNGTTGAPPPLSSSIGMVPTTIATTTTTTMVVETTTTLATTTLAPTTSTTTTRTTRGTLDETVFEESTESEATSKMWTTLASENPWHTTDEADSTEASVGLSQAESQRQPGDSVTSEPINEDDRFDWTIDQKNLLLGAFYYTYFFFMIAGGRIAEIYGAKYLLFLSCAGSACINLLTPYMARNNFVLLVLSRCLTGIIQSSLLPAMYALINRWLTMSEASIFAPMIKLNLRLGTMIGSLLPGIVPHWQYSFYSAGILGLSVSVLFLFVATSTPQENIWVSEAELAHIMRKKRGRAVAHQDSEDAAPHGFEEIQLGELKTGVDREAGVVEAAHTAKRPPTEQLSVWERVCGIMGSKSVIGLIIAKSAFNLAFDFIVIELPMYLRNVHHASKETISLITTSMAATQVCLIIFVGWLAKVMVKKPPFGVSKTAVRVTFQGLTNFGMGGFMLLATFNDCNVTYVGVLFLLVSLMSMFEAGGATMLPYDLSDEYPATIMAIANSIANVSGIVVTLLTGAVLGKEEGSIARWNLLLTIVGSIAILGGLVFAVLVKADPIEFGRKKKREATSRQSADDSPTCHAVMEGARRKEISGLGGRQTERGGPGSEVRPVDESKDEPDSKKESENVNKVQSHSTAKETPTPPQEGADQHETCEQATRAPTDNDLDTNNNIEVEASSGSTPHQMEKQPGDSTVNAGRPSQDAQQQVALGGESAESEHCATGTGAAQAGDAK